LAFSYWFDKPQFLTEGKLVAMLIIPSLGVPKWLVIYINTAPQSSCFLAPFPGKKKISARGVSHAYPLLCLVLLYFIFACFILSKIQKKLVSL
jgi:hypothetical protein